MRQQGDHHHVTSGRSIEPGSDTVLLMDRRQKCVLENQTDRMSQQLFNDTNIISLSFFPGLLKVLRYTNAVHFPYNFITYVQFKTNFLHNIAYFLIKVTACFGLKCWPSSEIP
jgi:hypothetical protein